jgi:hypothetical protein
MEKKGEHQEEEKKGGEQPLIRQIESINLDESNQQIISPSALITQQQDPIVAIEKELKIKFDADTKD